MNEFRIVIQVEQLDDNGEPLAIYGPDDPVVLWETDDADAAIRTMRAMAYTVDEEFDNG